MKKSFFNKIKGYIGIILIVLAITGIYYWENYGREQLLYDEVLAFNTEVFPNTLIDEKLAEEIITIIKIDKANMINNPILDINKIIGLETKQYIPMNAQLSPNFFDKPELVLNEDEYIFSIHKDWVYAFPSTLRRKDIIHLYKTKIIDLNQANSISDESYIDFENQNINVEEPSKDEFVLSAAVAYVKDSANREVIDINNDERLDASGNIDKIEIVVKKADVDILKEYVNSGYKFIIMYQ